jgi:predicted nucleotidyltransferase
MTAIELLPDIKSRLSAAFGERLRGVVLYGSEARGEAAPDSDIDVLVLLDEIASLWDDTQAVVKALYPLQWEVVRPIHATPVDVRSYETADYPLFRNAKKEGIRV